MSCDDIGGAVFAVLFAVVVIINVAALGIAERTRRYRPYCARCGGYVDGGRCSKCGARP